MLVSGQRADEVLVQRERGLVCERVVREEQIRSVSPAAQQEKLASARVRVHKVRHVVHFPLHRDPRRLRRVMHRNLLPRVHSICAPLLMLLLLVTINTAATVGFADERGRHVERDCGELAGGGPREEHGVRGQDFGVVRGGGQKHDAHNDRPRLHALARGLLRVRRRRRPQHRQLRRALRLRVRARHAHIAAHRVRNRARHPNRR
mmetsp:Transcript_1291/g.2643  ORF Transcript_1291/g.2643 Transcript_1291/m.2643 type:complete len:205 (-) Transcript_1291:60-674(-)